MSPIEAGRDIVAIDRRIDSLRVAAADENRRDLADRSRSILVSFMCDLSLRIRHEMDEKCARVDRLSLELCSTFAEDELLRRLPGVLDSMGVGRAAMRRFPAEGEGRILRHVFSHGLPDAAARGSAYDVERVFAPPGWKPGPAERSIAFPMHFGDDRLGVLLMEGPPSAGHRYESLFTRLCTAVQGSDIMSRTLAAHERLEANAAAVREIVGPMIPAIDEAADMARGRLVSMLAVADRSRSYWQSILDATKSVESAVAGMDAIRSLVAAVDDIGPRVQVVALSAAIEAARLGNKAHGFGVISRELRVQSESVQRLAADIKSALAKLDGLMNASVASVRVHRDSFNELDKDIVAIRDALESVDRILSSLADSGNALIRRIDHPDVQDP